MKLVSFDCATKSLGVSVINYNMQFNEQVNIAYQTYMLAKVACRDIHETLFNYIKLLDKIIYLIDTRINIEYLDVIDVIPGKKVKETDVVERTMGLYRCLAQLQQSANLSRDNEYTFLVEYQMGPNDKSRSVAAQIMMFFAKYCEPYGHSTIKVVGPSLKNKVVIGGDDAHYSNFIEMYTTNYAANKNHAKYNFLKLLKYLKKEDYIKHIKKSNIDDIADSVMMSIGYYLLLC